MFTTLAYELKVVMVRVELVPERKNCVSGVDFTKRCIRSDVLLWQEDPNRDKIARDSNTVNTLNSAVRTTSICWTNMYLIRRTGMRTFRTSMRYSRIPWC
jgi:hypothetical protein